MNASVAIVNTVREFSKAEYFASAVIISRPTKTLEMVQRVDPHPKPRPRFIEPMECQRVAKLPEGERWVYEPKQDGYRVIAVIDGNTSVLHSMSGLNYTKKYPHIAEA